MADTLVDDQELLKRTLQQLPAGIRSSGLAATIPAPAPSQSGLVSLKSLPPLDMRSDDDGAQYQLGDVIGEGGMGRVQRAGQRILSRDVAVKRLRTDLDNLDACSLLLLDEAVLTGSLEHPNICPVYALGLDEDGRPAMVMKRLLGVSWADLLDDPEHSLVTAREGDNLVFHLEVLMQVCNALHFAHARKVFHRDVKPENVMVGEYGEVYLVDWGVAYVEGESSATGAIVGTLAYMAPEMLQGAGPHITARTDVYLLGATLHHVLCGYPPHMFDDLDAALLHIYRSDEPEFGETVPGELVELCRRALRKDPNQRPSSALAFRAAIGEYLSHRGSYELASAAMRRLNNLLGAELDPAEMNRLYIECAFGFRQALDSWDNNHIAKDGLQRAGVAMVQFELARGNVDGAEALASQLLERRVDLEDDIRAARADKDAERREMDRLRQEKREQDPTSGSGARALSAIVTGVVLASIFIALAQVYPAAEGLTHRTITYVTLSLGAALGGGALLLREKLLATRINRYLSAAIFAIVVGCILVHVTGDLASAPAVYGLVADLLIAGTVVGHRRLESASRPGGLWPGVLGGERRGRGDAAVGARGDGGRISDLAHRRRVDLARDRQGRARGRSGIDLTEVVEIVR